MAEGRLASLMRRLKRQPQLLADYHREIHQWQERGFIAPATFHHDGPHCYLPHHPVIRDDKSTTKIRPVFDGSASTKEGPSLNNRLETGPELESGAAGGTPKIPEVSKPSIESLDCRHRKSVPEYRPARRGRRIGQVLVVRRPYRSSCNTYAVGPTAFKWLRVPFGLVSSPFILLAVIRKHLKLFLKSRRHARLRPLWLRRLSSLDVLLVFESESVFLSSVVAT